MCSFKNIKHQEFEYSDKNTNLGILSWDFTETVVIVVDKIQIFQFLIDLVISN